MDNILNELKDIEHQLEGNEYSKGGVSYYFAEDKLLITESILESLKKYLLNLEVIRE